MDKKFIDIQKCDEYEVLTHDGWKDFEGIGKTIEYQVYELMLENKKSLKGADHHLVSTDNGIKQLTNLSTDDLVDTNYGLSKVKYVDKKDNFENMYDLINVDGALYYTNDILSHNSTVVGVVALWYAIFNKDKLIGITSYVEKEAIGVLDKIKIIYEELPEWLKPGVKEYNKKSIVFDNGSIIRVSATTKNAFRGKALNLLICDELAFVQPNQAEDFWSSNFPTISKSQESKVILISTPKGQHNLFHRLWVGATNGLYNHSKREPGKNSFVPIKYDWRCLPERTEEWAKNQRESLGDTLFRQEHSCEFLGSINTVIDADVLKKLFESEQKDPILYDLLGKFRVYQKPINGAQYTLGVDTAKGTGENYSTIQVLRMDSINPIDIEQVAVYECNRTDPYHFANIINRIAIYYNNAYIMVENNAEGWTVASELHWNYENEGLVNSGSKTTDLGIRATKKSKNRAVILMKKMIENNMLVINDYKTVIQLTDFTENANGSFSCNNLNDDLLAALWWGVYIVKQDIFEEDMSFKSPEDDEDEGWGLLSDIDDYEESSWDWL